MDKREKVLPESAVGCCRNVSLCVLFALGLAAIPPARGATIWQGPAGGDWFDAGNWSAGVPLDGTNAVIDGGASVLLTNATASLGSFTLENATLVMTNWNTTLRAGQVTIGANGVVTLPIAFTEATMSNRIHIVCDSFILEETGELNADELGYTLGTGPGSTADTGTASSGSGGAGHGGIGGMTSLSQAGGVAYGDPLYPEIPGSSAGNTERQKGRPGGGAIRLEVSADASIHGLITANGAQGLAGGGDRHSGGSSGGSILVFCETIAGNGTVRADGGDGVMNATYPGGGGAGGRIALHFDPEVQALLARPGMTFSVAPGATAFPLLSKDYWRQADWGSLYFSDPGAIVDRTASIEKIRGYLHLSGGGEFASDHLSIGPGGALGFDTDVILAVTNNITVAANAALMARNRLGLDVGGTLTNRGTVWFSSGTNVLDLLGEVVLDGPGSETSIQAPTVQIGGDLRMDASELRVFGGVVATPGVDAGGNMQMAGAFILENAARVYPYAEPNNGGAVRVVCGALNVDATSGFDADEKGYAATKGPGGTGGAAGAYAGSGGAGHGGAGGSTSTGMAGGSAYGDPVYPRYPGSGAGGSTSSRGTQGGGVVWIEALQAIHVDGFLSANGEDGLHASSYRYAGGGAGGSILLVCETLSGAGIVQADGGAGYPDVDYPGGGGAGGRIAIHFDPVEQNALGRPDITYSAAGGNTAFPFHARQYWIRADWGSLYMSEIDALVDLTPPMQGFNGYLLEPGMTVRSFSELSVAPGHAFGFDGAIEIQITGGIHIPANAALIGRKALKLECGGSLTNLGRILLAGHTDLDIGGEVDIAGENAELAAVATNLAVGADVRVRDSANLRLFGSPTNGLPGEVGGDVMVTGDIRIESGAALHPYSDPVNGGSVRITCRNLFVDADSGVDADYKGFGPSEGPGGTLYSSSSAGGSAGAGHGGRGGNASSGYVGGGSYGSERMPQTPGSGAGNTQQTVGGPGGGVIWIDAEDRIVLDGPMTANGENGRSGGGYRYSGGGAGGSILLLCKSLAGEGSLSAIGGNGYDNGTYFSGGGGGGRIAVWYGLDRGARRPLLDSLGEAWVARRTLETESIWKFDGVVIGVAGGTGFEEGGEDGSLHFFHLRAPLGSTIILR